MEMPRGRKHSTAHYFPNNTICIIGGTENTSSFEFASPLLTLHFDPTDLSLHSSASTFNNNFLPSIQHTSHILQNNSILSLFGLHPYYVASDPSHRYGHTSLIIDQDLYLIGGISPSTNKQVPDAAWKYSFTENLWTPFPIPISLSNHVSFTYKHWIISCFGQQDSLLSENCLWFDTVTSRSTLTKPSRVEEWPTARMYATVTALPSKYILYGGEAGKRLLDDVWQLVLDAPFQMNWKRLNVGNQSRSGHAGILINEHLILYYGGQTGPFSMASEPLYLNTSSETWIQKGEKQVFLRQLQAPPVKMNVGPIVGIVIGVIAVSSLIVGFFLWKRHKRRQLAQSRATKFSHSSNNLSLQQLSEKPPTIEAPPLPHLAVTHHSRLSTISLGTEFKFSTEDYARRQSSLLSSAERKPDGLKRMTLNLFSNNEQTQQGLFRNSRFLQPKMEMNQSRTSIGARSVSSVQWVGFNDHMDYKQWRGSSASSLHLAVKNAANRASSHYTESTPSSPKSAVFPQHLRDSAMQYYQENASMGN